MKTRFTTIDISCMVPELHEQLKGFRVHQVYDVDNKTFLIRLKDSAHESEDEISKLVLLIESGIRIHISEYEWPKNINVSGFAMKLRKHLRNKRIESIKQIGIDRIVDIQFGINEAAYHVIVELYDRGNVILTDHQHIILNLLRVRRGGENDDVKFGVRDLYPLHRAITDFEMPSKIEIGDILDTARPGDTFRKIFVPRVYFGPALLEHCFIEVGFPENYKITNPRDVDVNKLEEALTLAHKLMNAAPSDHKGIIIYKEHISQAVEGDTSDTKTMITYTEFHPMLFNQHKNSSQLKYKELDGFCKAVDVYFSSIEGQKIDQKALQQEKDALKKLEVVKKDHEKRLKELARFQEEDKKKAHLIEVNTSLVEKALLVLRSAIANQISWEEIKEYIREAQEENDPVALSIKALKLERNHFTMLLKDPFEEETVESLIDIDLDLSAYGNARKYYDKKRYAAKKEKKTLDASSKALKNAEIKAQQTLKEVAIKTSITKARKVLWFEKFFWFISSENYLVIAGKDAAQNEFIVKRHLKNGDLYVHADLHGASSIVIQNHSPDSPIPPKTLEEAGIMAVCYSSAWENKFSSRSWWVHAHQVSKTAPTGEYLTMGSFMIRGKKNYLPMAQLVMGFGFLFRLGEDSLENHRDERRIKVSSDDSALENESEEIEINLNLSDDEDENEDKFPDTKVKNVAERSLLNEKTEEDNLIDYAGSQVPRPKTQHHMKRSNKKDKDKPVKNEVEKSEPKKSNRSNQPNQLKRGQRYKLKKMKEKYKDQDDEERRIKMAIQGSAPIKVIQDRVAKTSESNETGDLEEQEEQGEHEEPEKSNVDNDSAEPVTIVEDGLEKGSPINPSVQNLKVLSDSDGDNDEDGDEDEEGTSKKTQENIKLLASLTGQPNAEDTVLYAIPVVGPYSALSNNKFRVKVMPGTNKRGKAGKTALNLFINDKTTTQREKDLLKSCKDQEIARNLPNKVKVTSVYLNALKKKR